MFFLLRLAFVAGLVLLLLPLGLKGSDGREVSVFDALGAAQAFIADMRGFCDRQPQACAVGGQMASHLAQKAQVGVRWVSDAIGAAPSGERRPAEAVPPAAPATGALDLTPQDLMPMWGGGENGRTVLPQGFQPMAPAAPPAAGQPPLPPRRPA